MISEEYQTAVCEWLVLNGVSPSDMPANASASITDGKLTVEMWQRDDSGKVVFGLDQRPVLETLTVPIEVPPTPEVKHWLRPACPTCGR